MKIWMTGMVNGKRFHVSKQIVAATGAGNPEMKLLSVYPQISYQKIHGFGGAFTDAAGYVYSLMDEQSRRDFLETYFAPEGMGYVWGRTSIDSCDFSTEPYAAGDDPDDTSFEHMDYSRCDRYVLPLLKAAEATAGRPVHMMLTPWSPPAWMKTNQSRMGGGALRGECADLWAEYICKYTDHCLESGVDVRLISAQNEPHAVQTWDSCIMTDAEEAVFLRDHLLPALKRHGLDERISILIWDHNKQHLFERASAVLSDPRLAEQVAGAAFHWYSGDHFENIAMTRESYPGKRLVFSEGCMEHSIFGHEAHLQGAIRYAHEYIGDLNAGTDTLIDWNLVLDEKGGPNHVGNFCDAPMMYDTVNKKLHKQLSLDYIGHFSRFIKPGAVRLGVSRFNAEVELTAARNPDGSTAVVMLNASDRKQAINLHLDGEVYQIDIPAGAITTCLGTL